MRDAVTLSQCLSITLRSLTTGITFEALKFVKVYLSFSGNYCARDAFNARQIDENCMNIAHFCPHTIKRIEQHFSITTRPPVTLNNIIHCRGIFSCCHPCRSIRFQGIPSEPILRISAPRAHKTHVIRTPPPCRISSAT